MFFFFFQAEDGIRDGHVTGVQTCALPILRIVFQDDKSKKDSFFAGSVSVATFGSEQYQWHSNIKGGIADPDGPLAKSSIRSEERRVGKECRSQRMRCS